MAPPPVSFIIAIVGVLTSVIVITTVVTVLVVKRDLRQLRHRSTVDVTVNISDRKPISNNLFGINIEEDNHAVSGGLWPEMVSNRGFEAGGAYDFSPWTVIGDESLILVSIDYTSVFKRNKAALKMQVRGSSKVVGVYNPGFWGMGVIEMEYYKLVFHLRSKKPMNITVSIAPSDTMDPLGPRASRIFITSSNWTREQVFLQPRYSEPNARLILTTNETGTVWFDQVSLMHARGGVRKDVFQMLADLKPGFVRFPGISLDEQLNSSDARIRPYIKDMLDGIEFATGDVSTTWGGLRSDMGRDKPFGLKYIAIGSDNCHDQSYQANYMEFYNALKQAYPHIQAISNCNGFDRPADQPADLSEWKVYLNSSSLNELTHMFDATSRTGPKAFVSEYAFRDGGTGYNLQAALSEAAFLMGLEKNSDIVAMASCASLLGNINDKRLNSQGVRFDSSHVYGTPSYWVQRVFSKSNERGDLVNVAMQDDKEVFATAITWNSNITVKVLNMEERVIQLNLSFLFHQNFNISLAGKTVLNSSSLKEENSLDEPLKVSNYRIT